MEATPEKQVIEEAMPQPPADGQAEAQPTAQATAQTVESELEAVRKALDEARAQAAEYLDGWQRARAEFANYKKRQEQQQAELRAFATLDLVRRLLPILDDFERAAKTLPQGIAHMTWIEGVMLIQRKLQLVLEAEGVKPIEVKPGDAFDPLYHEAVTHDEAEGFNSGQIIEELQRGYLLGERVIRPTLVRVAK
ncbi:MAG: nucleotide exchange factor GrpE [Thermoflexales bacterium]|nr:nucleotide exchange factor GrpE [Thermoflexales bacterium]